MFESLFHHTQKGIETMSFKSIFSKVLGVVEDVPKVLNVADPIISIFSPPAGAFLNVISTSIIKAEVLFTGPSAGQTKKDFATQEITGAISLAFALQGKTVPSDLLSQISGAIDGLVAVWNTAAAVSTPTTAK
jgi:hypothetical protein